MLDLYKRIKSERMDKGWTQSELARRMGYSDKSMIAKIENGKVDLPQSKIEAFAEIFGCTVSYLMGWEDVFVVGREFDYKKYYGEQKATLIEIIENANDKQIEKIAQMFELLAPTLLQCEDQEEGE